jgi:hypothetical protein
MPNNRRVFGGVPLSPAEAKETGGCGVSLPESRLSLDVAGETLRQTAAPEAGPQGPAQFQLDRRGSARTVLFVSRTPGFGGSEKHLLELIGRLGGSAVRSVILCAAADPYTDRLRAASSANVTDPA